MRSTIHRPAVAKAALLVAAAILTASACKAGQSDSEKVVEQAATSTPPATTAPATPPAIKGPSKPVAPISDDEKSRPKVVSSTAVLSLTAGGKHLYGIVSAAARNDPDTIVEVDPTSWTFKERGRVHAPARLLPHGRRLFVASKAGLQLVVRGGKSKKLHEGHLTAAVIAEDAVFWSDCPEGQSCSIGRTDLRSKKSRPVTDARFDVVHDVAPWGNKLWIAGRHRDPREGTPPSIAERNAHARWLLSGGGATLPAGARYAPGYLAEIDDQGQVTYYDFPTQRPVEVERDESSLLVLTEGTPGKGFSDGVLFRIDHKGAWTILATGLAMPDDLAVNDVRACWTTMPAKRFEIQCWNKSRNSARTLVSQQWNVLGFADDGAHLTFTVLTKGLYRLHRP